MRRISPVLVTLLAGLLLVAPAGAAHAAKGKAKASPWSAYFPAKGVTCTLVAPHADGTAESVRTKVVSKSPKKIVTYTSGQGRETYVLKAAGKLLATMAMSQRFSGMKIRVTTEATYPAPARLLRHGGGKSTVQMTLTLPKSVAKVALKHGRTLTLAGRFRVAGLGAKSITLADPAATPVTALGIRSTLRSFTLINAKPAFARYVKRDLRSILASLSGTEWLAPGRGTVQVETTDESGAALTATQTGCA